MPESIRIGIVGAGNRGRLHADRYADVRDVEVVAVADVDQESARELAGAYGAETFETHDEMLDEAALDAVSVCVHNNLHAPITIDALEAGKDVFCEKPIAATYTDAKRMYDTAQATGQDLAIQNADLFKPQTWAAKRLIDQGKLGDVYFGRVTRTRRRGRPYVNGYGTPSFVNTDSAGGGPVIDIGTYDIGQLLYLVGNADVERVAGRTFEFTDETFDGSMVGDAASMYQDRLDDSGYDVEDTGIGFVTLADGTLLQVRTAWHMYLPSDPNAVVGSQGGVTLDPFEYLTTTEDYETTTSFDLDEFEHRQSRLDGERSGYRDDQFHYWIRSLRGEVERIPTDAIALNSMLVMEGIYRSQEFGRELTAEEIIEHSTSTAIELD